MKLLIAKVIIGVVVTSFIGMVAFACWIIPPLFPLLSAVFLIVVPFGWACSTLDASTEEGTEK